MTTEHINLSLESSAFGPAFITFRKVALELSEHVISPPLQRPLGAIIVTRKDRSTMKPLLAFALTFGLLINAFGQRPQAKPAPSPQPTPAPTPARTPDTQGEDDNDVVRITTKLVQVDATVTDRDGKQVTNLTAEDFEIKENGRPQKITNFSYITSAPPAVTTRTVAAVAAGTGPPSYRFGGRRLANVGRGNFLHSPGAA